MKIKALSLKQPWASLIASGKKTLETRTWPTNYRGDLLICSSKKPKGQGPTGVALCLVEVVDCRPMFPEDEEAACCPIYPGAVAWELQSVRPLLRPFPVKGSLGIFEVQVNPILLDCGE